MVKSIERLTRAKQLVNFNMLERFVLNSGEMNIETAAAAFALTLEEVPRAIIIVNCNFRCNYLSEAVVCLKRF